jgi:flagellar operon protein
MIERINGLRPLHQAGALQQTRQIQGVPAFEELLNRQIDQSQPLKFSAHARERMAGRGISLSESDLKNLQDAANAAASKGSREALLMMNDVGFIVNVRNRTVLTALDTAMLNDRVVTNIDSAVFVTNQA